MKQGAKANWLYKIRNSKTLILGRVWGTTMIKNAVSFAILIQFMLFGAHGAKQIALRYKRRVGYINSFLFPGMDSNIRAREDRPEVADAVGRRRLAGNGFAEGPGEDDHESNRRQKKRYR